MSQVEVTLKSGAVVVADVDVFTISKGPGTLRTARWETPEEGATRELLHINLDEVAAVVWLPD